MYTAVHSFFRPNYHHIKKLSAHSANTLTGWKAIARMMSSSYQHQAERYERESKSQRDAGLEMISKLEIKTDHSILDLGCGTGSLAKVLSDTEVGPKGRVVAVDPDGERIKIAKELYSAGNIDFLQADDQTFPVGPYNFVICNVTIHWISDKEALFKRVLSNLHPGGQFAFTTTDGPPPIPTIGRKLFDELLGEEFLRRVHTEVKQYMTADEYKELSTKIGFRNVTVNTGEVFVKWRNLDHYIISMHGWFGGEFDPAQFDRDALQRIKEEYGDRPVEFPEPLKKLEVVLIK